MVENRDNQMESSKIIQCFPSSKIAACEDIFNGSPESVYIDMSKYERVTFTVMKNAGAVGTATAQIKSSTVAAGTSPTARAHKYRKATDGEIYTSWAAAVASGTTISAGADEVWQFSIAASDLSGDRYCGFKLTEVDSTAVDGMVFAEVFGPRYSDLYDDAV